MIEILVLSRLTEYVAYVSVNPPAPIDCPIGGRYSFKQYGAVEEQYTTRIQGITLRPRHQIDCRRYESVFKSCYNNPKKIFIDAEYCATLDHTGRPIGEYGENFCLGLTVCTQNSEIKFSAFESCFIKNSLLSSEWIAITCTVLCYNILMWEKLSDAEHCIGESSHGYLIREIWAFRKTLEIFIKLVLMGSCIQ